MDEERGSDTSKTQMDLVDLSASEQFPMATTNDDDSLHPTMGPKGFCVKEFEDQLQSLKKENFNLKLRIYFLEEKNPNVPLGAETLYKQNIDLKIENENLLKEVAEKQDLLCQASKALELLDEQKDADLQRSQMTTEELNQKIESLQHEVLSLQNALVDVNKSTLGNDTGYADFLGAVDLKDVEMQRKLAEFTNFEDHFKQTVNTLNLKIEDLKEQKRELEMQTKSLLYENNEMKDKHAEIENSMYNQYKKFKALKDFCNEKFNELHVSQHEYETIVKNNRLLSEKCEELEYSLHELSRSRQHEENDILMAKLEAELKEFKEKWASAKCDLSDTEEKLRETETERLKTLSILKGTLESLESERKKINELETAVSANCASGANLECARNEVLADAEHRKLLMKKNNEISQLKDELNQVKRQLHLMTSHELSEKNREIEKLTNLVKNLELNSHSQASLLPTRISLEQLSDSFNDLKFQQALEEKKRSQMKIDALMNELADVATAKTKKHVAELQLQMAIVVEKQEVTDSALGKCAELCAFTLDHLHELTQFLSALLQQKEIRESLSEMTMFNIQSAIEKTLEFSQQANRFSTSMDGRLSSLPNISSLELLMNTARDSLANIKHLHSSNKSVEASNDNQVEMIQEEMEATRKELEQINRVNQMLEDEIRRQLKKNMQEYKEKMVNCDREVSALKEANDELNSELLKSIRQVDELTSAYDEITEKYDALSAKRNDFEMKLETETAKKFQLEMRLETSESLAEELRLKLETINEDLSKNWITRQQHDTIVRRLEEDIVSGEAQVEAIRMELESLRISFEEKKMSGSDNVLATGPDGDKENKQETRRTIEISDDRRELLMSKEETAANSSALVSSSSEPNCRMCQRYKAKNAELKKYLSSAMDKLKFHHELKARNDSHIQKQLSNTETFLQQARFNMENILKSRNSQDQ